MPQVTEWGMGLGLHSYSDQGQEFEDHSSVDLNTHTIYQILRRSYYSQKGRGRLFQPPLPLEDKTVAHWILLGAELPCLPAYISHKHPILIYFLPITLSLPEFLLCGDMKNLNRQ